MFGITIKKTADLEAMSTKLANAEARVHAQEKKTKSAMIIGGSTTAVAAALGAFAHFGLGQGRKLNRDKIKNFDSVVEERDRVIGEKATLAKDLDNRTIERDAAMASGHKMVIAAETGNGAALNAAIEEHKTYSGWLYGKEGNSPEKVKERIDMFNAMLDEMRKADQTATATTTPATTTTTATTTTPATTTTTTPTENEELKAAQAAFDAACQKANELNTAYEAAKTAYDAIENDATKSADEKAAAKKTMDDAKTALDAAEANLKKAEDDLKALQAK